MSFTRKGLFACSPSTTRGANTTLDVNSNGDKFLYANGRSVYIRDLANPSICDEYAEHLTIATVARFSNNGNYVASGDISGTVRIWDVTQSEKKLKLETRPISNRINDICWDSESQRILAVGDGNQRFGHVFTYDTGNSAGEIIGHSKAITACSLRPSGRPFRAVTASHDFTLKFYHGTPYRFVSSISDHTNSIYGVKYSPNGEYFVSVGADRKIFMYEGLNAEKKADFNSSEISHKGTIYSLAWSDDSKTFATSSADCSVKLWDIETQKNLQTISLSNNNEIQEQQVGNLWKANYLVSLSLSGTLNYIDPREGKVNNKVFGHAKGINKIQKIKNEEKTLFSGDNTGKILKWDIESGISYQIDGDHHDNKVNGLVLNNNELISVGMDDTLRFLDLDKQEFNKSKILTESEPVDVLSLDNQLYVIATKDDHLKILDDKQIKTQIKLPFTPSCIQISPKNQNILVGYEGKGIHSYKYSKQNNTLESIGPIIEEKPNACTMSFSLDGNYFALGQTNGKITLYDSTVQPYKIITSRWSFHSSRIYQLNFSKDNQFVVSCSLDTNIFIYSIKNPGKRTSVLNAHSAPITQVDFIDYPEQVQPQQEIQLVSTGLDGNIKKWEVQLPV